MKQLAACLIVKDDTEKDRLDRCLKSFAPYVDKIFITGTKKPQNKIKKIAQKYNAEWSWFKWVNDFSAARNFNFEQAKDYKWVFWCDTDDVVVGAETFREAIHLAEQNGIKAVFARYLYQVELDEQGRVKNILIEHLRERLIRNDGSYKWVAPIHETLIEQVPTNKTDYQGFHVVHLTEHENMANSMWRNIEILEENVCDNPKDPRPIYYLAKAYFDTKEPMLIYDSVGEGMDSLTMELLKTYIRTSGWQEERAQAYEYLSMLHRERGEIDKAIQALLEATYEYPKFPSIYIQLALCYVTKQEWDRALHWIKVAGSTDIPQTTLVINPRDYKTMILEALFHVYINTGKLEEVEQVIDSLVELIPSEINIKRQQGVKELVYKNKMAHWCVKLANHLKETGQADKLRTLAMSIPREIAEEPVLRNLRIEAIPPREWGEDEIALWCGPGWEQWSPKSASKGIGGSEEAIIYLSKELSKLGWKVTVFANPEHEEGEYDGVKYVPYYTINWLDKFNIFISWRQVGLFDQAFDAKKTYLWNHDIQRPIDYTDERVNKIDKVFFLSEWHRNNVPSLPDDKIMITANGLNI